MLFRLLSSIAILAFAATTSSKLSVSAATTSVGKTKIIVPLYSWDENCWPELQTAAKANPNVSWIIIINPNSGPIVDAQDPSLYCVPVLRSVLPSSSILIGYVRTGYNSRSLGDIQKDVETYSSWKKIQVKGGKTVPLDGIFFDETSDTTTKRLQSFSTIAKTAFSNRLVKIVSNPGTAVGSAYFSNANFVVDYESAHSDYKFSDLPTTSSQLKQSIVMIHDFDSAKSSLTTVLKPLINAKVGAVFITDLKIAQEDVYSKFGPNWQEFVSTVAKLNG
ncbi:spherulation-specific family 4 protein [Sporobolomyces salmoneus]|uniref:spherulation-specific family 4 protein n=1 Tax=Sporobolomyces salmoneus TaxID=183962 RepID=UPI00316D4328